MVSPGEVPVLEVLERVRAICVGLPAARGRTLVIGESVGARVVTDPTILKRILVNLAKNALEAIGVGATVTIWAERAGEEVMFAVRNPGTLPEEVRHQLFHRSFSTKGDGRGIGTYSVKLLGERYLRGRVEFRSGDAEGTVFMIWIGEKWREG